ncbi:MAG: hypothetical protein D6740_13100 [Alphaproteobacteria bacterium]|nr:MAG: hypothetical protein D6740_13100 [Alphaproteobacteria bacterium]
MHQRPHFSSFVIHRPRIRARSRLDCRIQQKVETTSCAGNDHRRLLDSPDEPANDAKGEGIAG